MSNTSNLFLKNYGGLGFNPEQRIKDIEEGLDPEVIETIEKACYSTGIIFGHLKIRDKRCYDYTSYS